MATRNDPLRNFRFKIEIDGITQAGFSEAVLAETTLDVIDYREGTHPTHVQKLNGLRKNGNITLKWGMVVGSSALDLFKWFDDVGNGQIKNLRKKVTIHVFNEAGEPAARFVASECWPMKYDPPDLNAKGNDVTIELLELANEGVERVA